VVLTKETPLTKEEVIAAGKVQNPFVEIFWGIAKMPSAMKRVCVVQFFTWVAWFTYILYITAWVGTNIFHGDPNSSDKALVALFDEGVRRAALGLALNAVVTVIVSLALPPLSARVGIKPCYCAGQIVLAVCLMLTLFVETEAGALTLIALCGIPWSVVMVFPFTLVSMAVDESQAGTYMGVLNIFVVLPQLCVSLGIGQVVQLFHGNLAAPLAAGGVSSLIAAGLVWILVTQKEQKYEKLTEEDSEVNASYQKTI